MKQPDKAWWERARQVRDKLAQQLLQHPVVSMIDIGLDPQGTSDTPVLRVHTRDSYMPSLNLPDHIDSIPVRVVRGDYELQQGE